MDTLSLILMIIGAINWGLVGIFQFDLVAAICGRRFGSGAHHIHAGRSCGHMGHCAAVPARRAQA